MSVEITNLQRAAEAQALRSFKHYCQCGGYAWSMNGRPEQQPHMDWCPQHDEYREWWTALHPSPVRTAEMNFEAEREEEQP
jgi:hypothetical protein